MFPGFYRGRIISHNGYEQRRKRLKLVFPGPDLDLRGAVIMAPPIAREGTADFKANAFK